MKTILALGLVFVLGLSGCSGPRYRALDFEAGLSRAKAEDDYTDTSSRGNSLASFDVLTLASLIPDPWSAAEAISNIEANASGNPGQLSGAISLATWEGTRVYLGDTHERAYASFVAGVSYWMLGEDDNAAALWRNALDIDKESDTDHRDDFSVCQYLLARYYWKQSGQRDTANIYLKLARTVWGNNLYLSRERMDSDNLVLLVEVGTGPVKTTSGPQGSILTWERGPYKGGAVSVDVGGERSQTSAEILNTYEQARYSLRATGKTVLQATKGVATAAAIGYGTYRLTNSPVLAILAAWFLELMPADTRQWWGLPAQVQLASFKVAPGKHTIRIRCMAAGGDQFSGEQTTLRDVEVEKDRDTILLIRPVRLLTERNWAPPPRAQPKGIPAMTDAPARPGSPILDMDGVDRALRNRSPLYKYLPAQDEIAPPPQKTEVSKGAE